MSEEWPHIAVNSKTLRLCSNLLRRALLPVGSCGGCDVTYRGGRVWSVAPGCSAGLRGDGGWWHVSHQSCAALYSDVRVPLRRHVEDTEAVVVEARQLTLEHTCAPLTSTHAHRCLAVEDGQLATYVDTRARTQTSTTHAEAHQEEKVDRHRQIQSHTHTYRWSHTCIHTHTRLFECYTIHHPQATVRGWDRLSMTEQIEAVENRGEGWGRDR